MKVLILLKSDVDTTLQTILEQHKENCNIQMIHLNRLTEHDRLVDQIEQSDIVFTW